MAEQRCREDEPKHGDETGPRADEDGMERGERRTGRTGRGTRWTGRRDGREKGKKKVS